MPSPSEVIPRFAGKAALITGAGSGVGRATSVRLAREEIPLFLGLRARRAEGIDGKGLTP